jgi:hypothetical protein
MHVTDKESAITERENKDEGHARNRQKLRDILGSICARDTQKDKYNTILIHQ